MSGSRVWVYIAVAVVLIAIVAYAAYAIRPASAASGCTPTRANITITNNQPTATGPDFQQMVVVDSSNFASYEAGSLQNVRFFYPNCTTIPAWIESGSSNSSSNTTYWLRLLGGIPAYSRITVYIGFAPPSANNFLNSSVLGEAPQLSQFYGEYDNGAHVFNLYDNFRGPSLNTNLWINNSVASTGAIMADDGLTIGKAAQEDHYPTVYSKQTFSYGTVVDFYATIAESTGPFHDQLIGLYNDNNHDCPAVQIGSGGGPTDGLLVLLYNASAPNDCNTYGTPGLAFDTPHIYSILIQSQSTAYAMVDYGSEISSSSPLPPLPLPIGFVNQASSPGSMGPVYWIRTRAYPPGGVMPAYVVGAVAG